MIFVGERSGVFLDGGGVLPFLFYYDVTRGLDIVSGELIGVSLAAGRVDDDGNTFGENIPVIDNGGLLNVYGPYTNNLRQSENFSSVLWQKFNVTVFENGGPGPRDDMAERVVLGGGSGLAFTNQFSQTVGVTYTLSVYPKSATSVAQVFGLFGNGVGAPVGGDRTATSVWQLFALTYEATNSSSVGFSKGIAREEVELLMWGAQLTATSHRRPYVKTEDATVTVPQNFSDAVGWYRWPISEPSTPKLVEALQGTSGSNAQGRLTVPWVPQFAAGQETGNVNILSANDSVEDLLYFDATNNLIKSTDGTNTAEVALSPVAGTMYQVKLFYNSTGMQLQIDNHDPGAKVSFAGSFPNNGNLSIAWGSEPWSKYGDISISRSVNFPPAMMGGFQYDFEADIG